jgi:excisionase family DNA binding protein
MTNSAPQPVERLYTLADVANAISSTPETIRGYIHRGEIVASKIGRRYLVSASSLNEFISRKRSR